MVIWKAKNIITKNYRVRDLFMKDLSQKNRIIIGACLGLLFTVFLLYKIRGYIFRNENFCLYIKFLLI